MGKGEMEAGMVYGTGELVRLQLPNFQNVFAINPSEPICVTLRNSLEYFTNLVGLDLGDLHPGLEGHQGLLRLDLVEEVGG